jgi:hypothetical protein
MAQADQEEARASERRRADSLVIYAPCSAFMFDRGINEAGVSNLYCGAQNCKKNGIFSVLFREKSYQSAMPRRGLTIDMRARPSAHFASNAHGGSFIELRFGWS